MPNSYSLYNTKTEDVLPLSDKSVTMGRSEHCGLRLLDRDASREHARLFTSIGGLTITDLGSTNGTYVNGARITAARHLQPGDTIEIAGEAFTVRMESVDDATRMADVIDMTRIGQVIVVPPPRESFRRNFLGLFSFSRSAKASSSTPGSAFTVEHRATIDKYLDYFGKAGKGGKAVLFFHKNNKTLAVHCVAEGTNDNTWAIGRCETSYIMVDDESVSKRHANLSYRRGKWVLDDHKSTNGIMLHGVRRDSIKLIDEADIRMGDVKIYVRLIT